jgi:hypothetical protein
MAAATRLHKAAFRVGNILYFKLIDDLLQTIRYRGKSLE